MKHFFSITLLAILVGLNGRYLLFTSYIHSQKIEFRRTLQRSGVSEVIQIQLQEEELFVNQNGLEWKEKNKELLIEGVYHEVVRIEKKDGFAVVFLIADQKENELFGNYFALNNHLGKNRAMLLYFALGLIYLDDRNETIITNRSSETISYPDEKGLSVSSYTSRLIKPPETV